MIDFSWLDVKSSHVHVHVYLNHCAFPDSL